MLTLFIIKNLFTLEVVHDGHISKSQKFLLLKINKKETKEFQVSFFVLSVFGMNGFLLKNNFDLKNFKPKKIHRFLNTYYLSRT